MADRTVCPKDRKPARRVYVQVSNPDTGRSTSVALPFVFCGTPGFRNGHGVLTVEDGQHGLVALDKGTFATQMRRSHALTDRIPKGSRKGGKPSPKSRTKAKAPKVAPKGKSGAKAARKPRQSKLGEGSSTASAGAAPDPSAASAPASA